jgi:hypothetical protein
LTVEIGLVLSYFGAALLRLVLSLLPRALVFILAASFSTLVGWILVHARDAISHMVASIISGIAQKVIFPS